MKRWWIPFFPGAFPCERNKDNQSELVPKEEIKKSELAARALGSSVWSSRECLLHKGWKNVVLPVFGPMPNAGIKAADDTSAFVCARAAPWLRGRICGDGAGQDDALK